MKYWKVGNSVESHSFPHEVPGGIRIPKEDFDAFIASLPEPEPQTPPRDLAAEIDDHEARLTALEKEA